jgi:hypothetical protein
MSEVAAATGEAVEVGEGPKPVRIGLLGHGNVGAAFAELLDARAEAVLAATGAYGHAMANNYNGVTRPPVIFCRGGEARVVVRRETYDDLTARDV